MNSILFALWFYLPAGAANMAPVLAAKWHLMGKLNIPIDFNSKFRGKRLFGDHKTIRGFVAGYVFAVITLFLQSLIYENVEYIREISLVSYNGADIFFVAALFTLGALGGDAIESFFKRQAGVKPGISWAPFDQIDWIIGAVIISLFFTNYTLSVYLWAIAWGLLLHPTITVIGWLFKLRDHPI